MVEDAFVRMLLVAAAGHVADERDLALARAAAAWATSPAQPGAAPRWRPYLGDCQGFVCGRSGMEFWVDGVASPDALLVLVRLQPGTGWKIHGRYPVAHLGHALDVLATEELIPARFSTIGRRALEDHAEVLRRAAGRVLGADQDRAERACGLDEAAASARRYAGASLVVLP